MRRGFTWIELLVIVGVVLLASLLAMPVFLHVREASWRARCLSHLRSLSTSLTLYATSNDNALPFSMPGDDLSWYPRREARVQAASGADQTYWANALNIDSEMLKCPTKEAAVAYSYNGYLHAYNLDRVSSREDTIGLWEGQGNKPSNFSLPRLNCTDIMLPCTVDDHRVETILDQPQESVWSHGRGANFLFLDGHAAWRRLGQKSGTPTDPGVDPYRQYDRAGIPDKLWIDETGRAPLFKP